MLLRIGQNGEHEQLAAGQSGDTITGNTRDGDGISYYNVASAAADRAGVWHLTPAGTARRIAGLPTDGLANGLAIDPSRDTLYAADSRRGTIWTVLSAGGEATAWLTDPALAPGPSTSLGANGLRFHNGAVWVSNFSRGTLLRIPIADSGAAEPIQVVSSELDGIDDFSFLTGTSDVAIVALNTSHRIAAVYPNGTVRTILTASNGLASPTSTAVHGEQLYITDGGLVPPHDAKLQRATLDVAALLDDSC
ncbi:hypothetical protein MXD62_36000 [Frankia sp. Mgl5]|uniref:hypothetical protein n=1 Tax=Frankia sp. Mgl5 TaxID=2933793 RepID=UPI00200D3207|nr:hypothetical protein [Frankia sp. Mgl5]MCK9932483.1 hypothetical protein [Frankia sp. Mgl5]